MIYRCGLDKKKKKNTTEWNDSKIPLKSLLGYCNKYEKNCCFFISFSFYPSFELTPKITRETQFLKKILFNFQDSQFQYR